MGITLTDVLLFGKAQYDDIDNATLVIYRRNILRWSALGGYLDIIVKGVAPLSLPDAIADSLSYVKAFGGTEQRNLPDGYIERQFIYMMDGSYLLTDIVPTYDCKVEMDFQTTSIGNTNRYMGGRTVTYGGLFLTATSSSFVVDAFGTTADDRYTSSVLPTNNTRYKFIYDNQVATLTSGNSTLFTNTFTGTNANGAALAINALNNNGTIQANSYGIYLYSFKAWNGQGELVADYVPAVQKGTVPVVGFYDTVSGTFKTATAGTFAAGGEAVPTPDAPMDIVCNNGAIKCSANLCDVKADNVEVGKYISAQGALSDNAYNFTYIKYIPVKPNTQYTLTFSSPLCFASVSEYSSAGDSGFIVRQTKESTSTTAPFDLVEWTFTTGATTNFIRWGSNMYKVILTLADVLAVNWMLVQGSAQPYMPYGQIYADGTTETINVHGKNLFDKDSATVLNLSGNRTNPLVYRADRYGVYIPVEPSTKYTISRAGTLYLNLFETAFVPAVGVATTQYTAMGTATTQTITTAATTRYLYIFAGGTGFISSLQIEKGAVATDYAPYYDGGTATAEMLLKVGDYQDEQEILSGAVTRNVGVKVLDGTEGWQLATATDLVQFYTASTQGVIANNVSLTSTIAPYGCTVATRTQYDFGCYSGGSGNLCFQMKGSATLTTVSAWTQYLADQYAAGTPVIVLYPLPTPTTETVTGQTLQVTDGDNVLEITQASLTGLELEAQYSAAVSLTIQEVQDANLDPNVQVTIN